MADQLSIEHTTFAQMGAVAHTPTRNMPVHCIIFQIDERVILLDTGFGTREMQDPNSLLGEDALFKLGIMVDSRLTAFERLRSRGVGPDQVTDIILTHLDNDHAGGLHDFPNATVHISHEELTSYDGTRRRGPYKPYQISHLTKFKSYEQTDEHWFGLSARSLPLPGDLEAKLIPLPGHTMGHCGVAYREEGRWSLHAGDAYFDSKVNFLEPAPGLPIEIAFQTSAADRQASIKKLQALRADHANEVAVYCTHDQQDFVNWTLGRGKPDPISSAILLV